MKLSILASLFLAGTAMAAAAGGEGGGDKTIPIGGPCKKDGSMGNCEGGYCLQDKDAQEGKCQAQ